MSRIRNTDFPAARDGNARNAVRRPASTLPPLTLYTLNDAIQETLTTLALGPNSYRTSSTYVDYVAIAFAFFVDEGKTHEITRIMNKLCAAHGWTVCRVAPRKEHNVVHVTLQLSDMLSPGDARMATR